VTPAQEEENEEKQDEDRNEESPGKTTVLRE
jgi:hypothetical protein